MPRVKKQRLKKRKDGRYCCKYRGIQFMANTEEECLRAREEYKIRERTEQAIAQNPSVYQYAMKWLPVAKASVSEATYRGDAIHIQHLCDVIGNEYVRDVKPMQIRSVYSQAYLNVSDDYIKHAHSLFCSMFDAAIGDGLIRTNPARSDTAKPHKGTVKSHRAITQEERKLIETVALDHRASPAAIVMLYAGLRPQEVKALRVEDVDFDSAIIYIHSFVHKASNNQYKITEVGKTKKATRTVPLFAPVRKALEGKTGLVVSNVDGSQVSVNSFDAIWDSYCRAMETHLNGMSHKRYAAKVRIGIEMPPWRKFTVTPYDLRHSFATWCRDHGAELHTVVDWMGHANATMVLHIYDETSVERSASEAAKLEKIFDTDADSDA